MLHLVFHISCLRTSSLGIPKNRDEPVGVQQRPFPEGRERPALRDPAAEGNVQQAAAECTTPSSRIIGEGAQLRRQRRATVTVNVVVVGIHNPRRREQAAEA